jgi:hypothetical protein
LWAAKSLRRDLLPGLFSGPWPHLAGQVIPLAMLALAAGLFAVLHGAQWPRGRQLGIWILTGLGLFAVPAGLIALSGGWISELARTALFTLVPVFAVVFEPYLGDGARPPVRGGLIGSLVAVAGALLIFPIAFPASMRASCGWIAVSLAVASVAAANCLGVAAADELESSSAGRLAAMASTAGASAACVLAAASLVLERTAWTRGALTAESIWSAAVEVPGLLLLFWLMGKISAPRMAARFVLAPLLAVLIGVILMQSAQEVRLRTWAGLILMAGGSGWLLFGRGEETGATALPLDLDR